MPRRRKHALCRHSLGWRLSFNLWIPPQGAALAAKREHGGRSCHAPGPTLPLPTILPRWESSDPWARGVGPAFHLVWTSAVPLMFLGLARRLEWEPHNSNVKPVEPAQMLRSSENLGCVGLLSMEIIWIAWLAAVQMLNLQASNKWAKNWKEKQKLWFSAKFPNFFLMQSTEFCHYSEICTYAQQFKHLFSPVKVFPNNSFKKKTTSKYIGG